MEPKKESLLKKPNKILNYITSNFLTLILIGLLIYMRITGSYIHTQEQPVYVETCAGTPTGYVEYSENDKWVGNDVRGTDREWMIKPINTTLEKTE